MKIRTITAASLIVLLLAACRNEVHVAVPLSRLGAGDGGELRGTLLVEVTSCGEFEDSSKPSNALRKVLDTVPKVFPGAEYRQCVRKSMDSLALFEIPVYITRENGEGSTPKDGINLVMTRWGGPSLLLPGPLRKRLDEARSGVPGGKDIPVFTLTVTNDTRETRRYRAIASFIDGRPVVAGSFHLDPGQTVDVKLSDVSAATVMAGMTPPVLAAIEETAKQGR